MKILVDCFSKDLCPFYVAYGNRCVFHSELPGTCDANEDSTECWYFKEKDGDDGATS